MLKNAEKNKEIAEEVQRDFEKRKADRHAYENTWQLNINFLMGNQFCSMGIFGEIEENNKRFFWQQQEVFNHIAPIVEMRISKLGRVRPSMSVVPAGDGDADLYSAKLSRNIIRSVSHRLNMNEILCEATRWSEICGTVFYKVLWNADKGRAIAQTEKGQHVKEGDVDVIVVPPYEIYPDTLTCENLEELNSIIHARAYLAGDVKRIWNVEVEGENLEVMSLGLSGAVGGGLGYNSTTMQASKAVKPNHALVLERYQRPTAEHPNGRLTIVCGSHLLYDGELPYTNKNEGARGFPFVRQVSHSEPGAFFGSSIIERCIPIQRAYNAIKNRKHEFLNRISMGVLAVEDGSIDIENLEDEGLSPGKVLIYRQGSRIPSIMAAGSVPIDFTYEEERLLNEFTLISGVSDLMRSSKVFNTSNYSGIALQLLIEQDDSRISPTADEIRFAAREMARQIIRLYKQFAIAPRLAKIVNGASDIETFYFKGSEISSDDVVFETESELSESLAQKRSMVFELLKSGVLFDEDGRLSNRTRAKVLDMLGFGTWESGQDLSALQLKQADKENLDARLGQKLSVSEIDEHKIHISQHTAYLLGENLKTGSAAREKLLSHIREHKQAQKMLTEINEG